MSSSGMTFPLSWITKGCLLDWLLSIAPGQPESSFDEDPTGHDARAARKSSVIQAPHQRCNHLHELAVDI